MAMVEAVRFFFLFFLTKDRNIDFDFFFNRFEKKFSQKTNAK